MHGGATPSGIASPHWKHGRRSKAIPSRLLETYTRGLEDTEMLDLQDDLALIDARLNDVLGRVDTGEAGTLWRRLRENYDLFMQALTDHDNALQVSTLREIGRLLDRGSGDWSAWHEVQSLVEQRRKLVESEHKRRVAMSQMITAEQAMSFAMAILDTVKRNVTDRAALSAIQNDINRLVTQDVR